MVLTYDAYAETIEEKEQKKSEVKELKDKYEQDMKVMRQEIREGAQKPTTIVEAILFNVIRIF